MDIELSPSSDIVLSEDDSQQPSSLESSKDPESSVITADTVSANVTKNSKWVEHFSYIAAEKKYKCKYCK